ncbi:MAG: hypothetical protein HKN89_03445 [Eudoraea sp.]|nr:hypothetical protein [Eudoraea sp.]
MVEPKIILGKTYSDNRGTLIAFNDLDLSKIVRIYEIIPASESTIRAWQAHKNENKWFHCTAGAFLVNLINLDNFESPKEELPSTQYYLKASMPQVLHIPGGYANGFKALEPNSVLQVYSNFSLEESASDDYRFPGEKWNANWQSKEK